MRLRCGEDLFHQPDINSIWASSNISTSSTIKNFYNVHVFFSHNFNTEYCSEYNCWEWWKILLIVISCIFGIIIFLGFTKVCCGWPKFVKKNRTHENQNQLTAFDQNSSNINRTSFLRTTSSSNSNLPITIIASSSLTPNSVVASTQSSYHELVKGTQRRHSIEQDLPPSYEQVVTSNNR